MRAAGVIGVPCALLIAACGTTSAPTGQPAASSATPTASVSAAASPSAKGPAWTAPFNTAPNNLQSVSCPSTNFCMATDDATDYIWDGVQWKPQATPFSGNRAPVSVDCFADGTCLAGNNVAHIQTYRGGAWTITSNTLHGRGAWIYSCASSSFCLVANEGSYTVYTYDGQNFAPSTTDAPEVSANNAIPPPSGDPVDFWVACGSGGNTCVLADGLGNVSAYSHSGSRWSPLTNVDPGHSFFRTACVPSNDTCYAFDTGGGMFAFNGSTWTKAAASVPAAAIQNFQRPRFSCAATAFCMLTDTKEAFVYNGTSWLPAPGLTLFSNEVPWVSCESPTFCVVADAGGALWTYHGS